MIGGQSMVAPLQRVIVKDPAAAWQTQERVASQWQQLQFNDQPDLALAQQEHDEFVSAVSRLGCEVLRMPASGSTTIDSVYTHDPAILVDGGLVLLRMGKAARRPEANAFAAIAEDWDLPVVGWIDGEAMAEGGDVFWLDAETLVVGVGFRTNQAAVDQLTALLGPRGVTVLAVHLPYWRGPEHILHTMSFISMLDDDLAVVQRDLLPVPLYLALEERGVELIDVAEGEFETQACNVLAVAPRKLVMLDGNPLTQARIEAAGCEVETFSGTNISLCGDGGPTCLTRPILRR